MHKINNKLLSGSFIFDGGALINTMKFDPLYSLLTCSIIKLTEQM